MIDENKLYVPRDVSWLKFNRRVLKQANNSKFNLIERFNYLKISITNLNEFFSYRVPLYFSKNIEALNDLEKQEKENILYRLRRINDRNLDIEAKFFNKLLVELEAYNYGNYFYNNIDSLTEDETSWLEYFFFQKIYPSLSPQLLDNYHDFSATSFENVCIFLRLENNQKLIIPIPKTLSRIVVIPQSRKLIPLEKTILHFIHRVFFNCPVLSYRIFKLTKDRSMPLKENNHKNFPSQVATYIRRREQKQFSRLELSVNSHIYNKDIDQEFLENFFYISESTSYQSKIIIDAPLIEELMGLIREDFEEATLPNVIVHNNRFTRDNIFELLDKQDLLLHHPYDSFQPVLNFIERAAVDYKTVSIKQTLYRVSIDSKIVKSLCQAAENGKLVYVIIELKAKEDEQNNLDVAKKLQESGCIVSYGKANHKVHSKLAIIFMKDGKRYAHVGTGNYNETTAELYTDLSLLTTKKKLVDELNYFFDSLSGETQFVNTSYIVTSPNNILSFLLEKMETMIAFKKKYPERKCVITLKVNSLTNYQIIKKLYEASSCNIDIFLIVRGACSVIPKRKNLSENIKVVSYVGKFLEHSRIYSFDFGGSKEHWVSSSDLMDRNLFNRYELAVRLDGKATERYCQEIIDTYLNFSQFGYTMDDRLSYRKKDNQVDISIIFNNLSKYRSFIY